MIFLDTPGRGRRCFATLYCPVEDLPHLVPKQGLVTSSAESVWWRECSVSHADTTGHTGSQALVAEELKACASSVSHRTVRRGQKRGTQLSGRIPAASLAKLCWATRYSPKQHFINWDATRREVPVTGVGRLGSYRPGHRPALAVPRYLWFLLSLLPRPTRGGQAASPSTLNARRRCVRSYDTSATLSP